jgi:hypothetical protein
MSCLSFNPFSRQEFIAALITVLWLVRFTETVFCRSI